MIQILFHIVLTAATLSSATGTKVMKAQAPITCADRSDPFGPRITIGPDYACDEPDGNKDTCRDCAQEDVIACLRHFNCPKSLAGTE